MLVDSTTLHPGGYLDRISKYVVCQEGRCALKVDPYRSSDPNIRFDAHKVPVLQGIKVVEQLHIIHYDPLFYDMTCIPEEHNRELSESNILRLTACSYPLKGSNRIHRAHVGDLFLLNGLRGRVSQTSSEEGISRTGQLQEPAGHWQEVPQLHPWSPITVVSIERNKR